MINKDACDVVELTKKRGYKTSQKHQRKYQKQVQELKLKQEMKIGSKIKLISFNGDTEAPKDCLPSENYWLLIGKTGFIVKGENIRSRVLVQFEEQVNSFGLHCHNEIPNSLLILMTDIELI